MAERLTIRTPVDDSDVGGEPGFRFGTGFGFYIEEASGTVRFWDGHDVWLPISRPTLFASFKGLLRFVPSGDPILRVPDGGTPPGREDLPFVAVGDALVLELWPPDFLRLKSVLPDTTHTPKHIVYQNVDRASAIDRAVALVDSDAHRDRYLKIFTREGESEPPDAAEFTRRVRTWAEDEWATGQGIGVFVDPGEAPVVIGDTAPVPSAAPPGLSEHARVDHGAPSGTADWARLTLKVLDNEGRPFSPAFLFYLLQQTEDEALDRKWERTTPFTDEATTATRALPVVQVATDTREDESEPLEDEPPPALPSVRLRSKRTDLPQWIAGLYDPFERPETGFWRMQSPLPDGEYDETYDAPQLYAQATTPRRQVVPGATTPGPYWTIVQPTWLPFHVPGVGHRRRFLLGVNMEVCRQKHFRDLAGNELMFDYYRGSRVAFDGQLQLKYVTSPTGTPSARRPWMSRGSTPTPEAQLREDFRAMREMGARAVRVWASEYMEGIRFQFTAPTDEATGRGSLLMNEREDADRGASPDLHSYVFPPTGRRSVPITIHACSAMEFSSMRSRWSSGSPTPVLEVQAESNPRFQELVRNARSLQTWAGEAGLRVLWCLFTHFGEARPEIGHENLIFYAHETRGLPSRTNASGQLDASAWRTFYHRLYTGPAAMMVGGRLSVDAWIYKSMIEPGSFRRSLVTNFVRPFVREMESLPVKPLGYEIMNESSVLWDSSPTLWTYRIQGNTLKHSKVELIEESGGSLNWGVTVNRSEVYDYTTDWKMSTDNIRAFIGECLDAVKNEVRTAERTVPAAERNQRVFLSGALGTEAQVRPSGPYTDVLPQELVLLRPPADHGMSRALDFSASAFSKYARPLSDAPRYTNLWHYYNGAHGVWSAAVLARKTVADPRGGTTLIGNLVHHGRLILVEGGDSNDGRYLGTRQQELIEQMIKTAVLQGLAGVFVWHYHNPLRLRNPISLNYPLTENPSPSANPEPGSFLLTGTNVKARLGVLSIQFWANRLGRLLVPRPTP